MSRTATLGEVASSASAVTLAAINRRRKKAHIVNVSSAILYVKLGSDAAADDFTFKVAANSELPFPIEGYTGIITGIWASANGNAYVSEW